MITIVNISTADISWGTVVIQINHSMPITNNGITTGDHVLTFEQFSVNTNLIEIENNIEIYDGTTELQKDEAVEWIEKFYNNPMSEFDSSAGTGDMKKEDYDVLHDGAVDKAETVTIKLAATPTNINTLTSPSGVVNADDVIGVHIGGGVAVVRGRVMLKVRNNTTTQQAFIAGVNVYYGGIDGYGSIKSSLPGFNFEGKDSFYVGTILETTQSIPAANEGVAYIDVNVRRNSIYNPDSDGSWLRRMSGPVADWTEDINGGTY